MIASLEGMVPGNDSGRCRSTLSLINDWFISVFISFIPIVIFHANFQLFHIHLEHDFIEGPGEGRVVRWVEGSSMYGGITRA